MAQLILQLHNFETEHHHVPCALRHLSAHRRGV